MTVDNVQERVKAEGARLHALLDEDPFEAIAEARRLEIPGAQPDVVPFMQAAIFIDGGNETESYDVVAEGVSLLRNLVEAGHDSPMTMYNLANGLSSLATHSELLSSGPGWLLETASDRREARRLYDEVAETAESSSLRARAKTNLANMLVRPGRWAEAYEVYVDALRADPANSIASSGAAKLLLHLARRHVGNPEVLHGLAQRYMRQAQDTIDLARAHSGRRADEAVDTVEQLEAPEWELDLRALGPYERFVARERLVLSPTVEGLDPGLKRWDALRVEGIRESIDTPHGVPPLFAMFNQLKSDFLAARWLAFRASEDPPTDSGSYWDSLDYAVYGLPQSLLTLAHRSAIDLLDRVAVAATEYFSLPGRSRNIYFWSRWHVVQRRSLKTPIEWQATVSAEIEAGNLAVAALAELAEDIAEGGFLNRQRDLRHVSTHRFAVLHDMGAGAQRESPHIEHFDVSDFQRRTIHALRIARAAILYLTEAIALREARLARDGGPVGTLVVPTHHYVRGEDDDPEGSEEGE